MGQTHRVMNPGLPPSDDWFGAVLADNGRIYGMPDSHGAVIEVDPEAIPPALSTFGSIVTSCDGGRLALNGLIYCIPFFGPELNEIDPVARTTRSVPAPAEVAAGCGFAGCWAGSVLAPNGRIYGVPFGASQVLVIDVRARGSVAMDVLLSADVNTY